MKKVYLLALLCYFSIIGFSKSVAGATLNCTTLSVCTSPINVTSFIPAKIFAFVVSEEDGKDLIKWDVSVSPDLAEFQVESSTDDINFMTVDNVYPKVVADNVASYAFYSPFIITGTRYYRLKLIYNNGDTEYSSTQKLDDASPRVKIIRSSLKQFELVTPYVLRSVNVLNESGVVVRRYLDVTTGTQIINMSNYARGIYIVQCFSNNKITFIKILNA